MCFEVSFFALHRLLVYNLKVCCESLITILLFFGYSFVHVGNNSDGGAAVTVNASDSELRLLDWGYQEAPPAGPGAYIMEKGAASNSEALQFGTRV